jgi:hypothetical protein
MTPAIILVAALVFFVMFILWASKSIPRAIVFVVVFPVLLAISLVALMAFNQNADSGPPQHVERAKR